jgi:hypothetical protein
MAKNTHCYQVLAALVIGMLFFLWWTSRVEGLEMPTFSMGETKEDKEKEKEETKAPPTASSIGAPATAADTYPFENFEGLLIFTKKNDCADCVTQNPTFLDMYEASPVTVKIVDAELPVNAAALTHYKVQTLPSIIMCHHKDKQKVAYTGPTDRATLMKGVDKMNALLASEKAAS